MRFHMPDEEQEAGQRRKSAGAMVKPKGFVNHADAPPRHDRAVRLLRNGGGLARLALELESGKVIVRGFGRIPANCIDRGE
jgi:hypothetical protein